MLRFLFLLALVSLPVQAADTDGILDTALETSAQAVEEAPAGVCMACSVDLPYPGMVRLVWLPYTYGVLPTTAPFPGGSYQYGTYYYYVDPWGFRWVVTRPDPLGPEISKPIQCGEVEVKDAAECYQRDDDQKMCCVNQTEANDGRGNRTGKLSYQLKNWKQCLKGGGKIAIDDAYRCPANGDVEVFGTGPRW